MTLYLWLRLAKLVAVSLFVTGSLGAVFARNLDEQRRFAYQLASTGFGLTWVVGFVLVGLQGISFLSLWILGSLFLSLVAINGVLFVVGRSGRRSWRSTAFVLVPLLICFWLMVTKPQ